MLTPADRKWMDEIVGTVEATWNAEDMSRPVGEGFKGSDDYLRGQFEVSASLSLFSFRSFFRCSFGLLLIERGWREGY